MRNCFTKIDGYCFAEKTICVILHVFITLFDPCNPYRMPDKLFSTNDL